MAVGTGGAQEFLSGVLISDQGEILGSHCCSHEDYMPHDLGTLEGTRPDRHEVFREKFPEGYRMEFVGYDEAKSHAGLQEAFKLHEKESEQDV